MSNSFDLFVRPFVSWPDRDGRAGRYGVRDLFRRAGELLPFGNETPQTTFAVVRILLVLMHQTRPICPDDEWQRLWNEGQFSGEWFAEIEEATRGKLDLLDPKRPFFQRTDTTDDDAKDKPASYLISHFAAGTGINFASHTIDDQAALCPACCGRGLIELPAFCGAGGAGLMASINNTLPVYFLPVGSSLFHTLLLNWPLADRVPGDHPQWEPGKPPKRIGLLEGFTWEPRTVRLFPVPAEGRLCTNCGEAPPIVVRRIVFSKGVPASKERLIEWRDPHVCYEEITVGRKTQIRSITPPEPDKRPAAALGFWRKEIAALLRMSAADDGDPEYGSVARTRGKQAGADLTVSCVVPFTRPGQDKKHLVRSDLWTLPPMDAKQLDVLRGELKWIEDALAEWAARTVADERPVPEIAPLAEFERLAEAHFRDLLAGRLSANEWREKAHTAAKQLTRPEPIPGRALEAARVQQAVKAALEAAFPLTSKEAAT